MTRDIPDRALTPSERKALFRRAKKVGHAALSGSGPAGETCKTCAHIVRVSFAKTYIKCGRNQQNWTRGPGSDIRASDPACGLWEKKT